MQTHDLSYVRTEMIASAPPRGERGLVGLAAQEPVRVDHVDSVLTVVWPAV
jgi:hypothetical protein